METEIDYVTAIQKLKDAMIFRTFPGNPSAVFCDVWEWEEFLDEVGMSDD